MATRGRRLGSGAGLGLATAAVLVVSLAFALGVMVGRQWARPHLAASNAEAPAAMAPEGRGLEVKPLPAGGRPEREKLTFYQTLTAPVGPAPVTPAPAERRGPAAPAAASPAVARPQTRAAPAGGPAPERRTDPLVAGRWAVQVGAFKNRDQAEGVQRRLAGSGYQVTLTQVMAADGLRYRVRIGSYPSRVEAEQVAARVKSGGGLSTFVTPL